MNQSEVYKQPLGPWEKFVLLALLDYGKRAFPKQETLATKCSMSRRQVQRSIARLKAAGYVTTKGAGKALTYHVNCAHMAQVGAPNRRRCCAHMAHQVRLIGAGILTSPINEPNQPRAADAAGVGWEVPDNMAERIRARDPRADFAAQARVCRRILAQHGLTQPEAQRTWLALCAAWASTGNNAYEVLAKLTLGLEEARSPRAVLLHRLKEVAA